jgi:integrase
VDLKRGLLTVSAAYSKNGASRTVPLNSVVRTALSEMKQEATIDLVFVGRGGKPLRSIRNAFERACQDAGLKNVTPHTLRHTFASRLAMAGVDARTIQELGGWKTLALVERYSHLSPSHKAEAVERIVSNSPTLFQQQPIAAGGGKT